FFFQAEDGIRCFHVTGVQTCALPILIYLAGTLDLLYPGSAGPRAYTLLPHARLPRRLAPRRWWHPGRPLTLPTRGSIAEHLTERSEERRVGREGRWRWAAAVAAEDCE